MDAEVSSKFIDLIGGTCELSRVCDITPQAVSRWRKSGIPKHWIKFLEKEYPNQFNTLVPRASRRG